MLTTRLRLNEVPEELKQFVFPSEDGLVGLEIDGVDTTGDIDNTTFIVDGRMYKIDYSNDDFNRVAEVVTPELTEERFPNLVSKYGQYTTEKHRPNSLVTHMAFNHPVYGTLHVIEYGHSESEIERFIKIQINFERWHLGEITYDAIWNLDSAPAPAPVTEVVAETPAPTMTKETAKKIVLLSGEYDSDFADTDEMKVFSLYTGFESDEETELIASVEGNYTIDELRVIAGISES